MSCSKDAYEEVLSYDKNSIKVVVLNSTAIKKEKPLFTKISKLNQNLSSLNSQEKNISSGVYNFSIDTEYCKMITLDSITTYTFNVIREPSNDDFENLVIKKLPNGSLITKLYKYNVTPLEKHNILHGIDVDMTNKIEVSDINDTEFTGNIFGKVYYSGSLCYQAEMVMTSGTSCKGDDHHAYGDLSCPFINSPYMQAQAPTLSVVYVPIDCGGAGSGSGTTGTGNTGGGVSSGHGIVTSPIVPTISFEESMFKEFKKKSLTTAQNNWLTTQNENVVASILNYLSLNDFDASSKSYIINLINYLLQNSNLTFDYVMDNKTSFNDHGEIDNYTIGNYDNTVYSDFNPFQNWSNISSVIPLNKFVGWNSRAHPTWQCMEYSKEQLRVVGYQISNYYATGQTFQIYTSQNGVNTSQLSQGLSYLKHALSNGIPVVVGVDDAPGHPGNLDSTTDHFIVIVGMGHNSNGNYFQFYDNASASASQGASPLNLLYYNSTTGIISGSSQTSYGQGQPYPYILTMIRKSKLL